MTAVTSPCRQNSQVTVRRATDGLTAERRKHFAIWIWANEDGVTWQTSSAVLSRCTQINALHYMSAVYTVYTRSCWSIILALSSHTRQQLTMHFSFHNHATETLSHTPHSHVLSPSHVIKASFLNTSSIACCHHAIQRQRSHSTVGHAP